MTYQVLARKWRPRSFREMAGQSHVLKTLINSLDNNRLHHAYLFTGTRGVGKTTIARILAKCLNCETGISAEPCGECTACREIDEGRFIDLIEVDAASRTRVEDTRELLDNVQYSPTRGRFKVYLIDEVHMLSGHSFNALLKTLEEPPPHVKFLLATTDPQKLPITILSRCLQFNLKNLSPEQLVQHLAHILKEENIPAEEPALWQLARAAQGSVRDSLTLLDQAIAYCDGNIRDDEVRALLGTIDQSVIHKLVEALAAGDGKTVLTVIDNAASHAPDFGSVLEALLAYLHRVAIAQVVPEGIDNSQGDRDSVLSHASGLAAENVQLYYQIALKGREELPLSVDGRSGLEMTLLRMLAFTPQGVPNQPREPLPAGSQQEGQQEPQHKKPAEPPREEETEVKKKSPLTEVAAAGGMQVNGSQPEPVPQSVQQPIQAPAQESSDSSLRQTRFNLAELQPEHWIELFYQLQLTGITRNIASHCVLTEVGEGHLGLLLHDAQGGVFNEKQQSKIESALQEYFGKPLQVGFTLGEITARHGETPAAWRRRKETERQQEALDTFKADDNVREIVERFSGTILTETVESLRPKQE